MTKDGEKKPRSRFWKWVRRLCLACMAFLLLLALFHRPLLRALVASAGPWAAKSQGLNLAWNVAGSILGDIELSNVEAGGGDGHWLPEARVGSLTLDYDLWRLLQDGPDHALSRVVLHDVEVEVDLRKLPATEAAEPEAPSSDGVSLPPIPWPDTLDLHHVTAHVTLADGRQIVVRDFSFRAGDGTPGIISIEQFSQEPDEIALGPTRGTLDWGPHRIGIRDLELPLGLRIQKLLADVSKLPENGDVMAELDLGIGEGKLHLEAAAFGLLEDEADLDLALQTLDLHWKDLEPFGLPETVVLDAIDIGVKASGDPRTPGTLRADVSAAVSDIAAAGARVDAVKIHAALADGELKIETSATRATNEAKVSVSATLPVEWAAWEQTAWQAETTGDLPEAMAFLDEKLPFSGMLQIKGQASGRGATPLEVTAHVEGGDLAWEQWKLPQLAADITMNGDRATMKIPELPLGKGNTFSADVSLGLKQPMPAEVAWSLKIDDPQSLLTTTGVGALDAEAEGTLASTGKARLDIEAVSKGDYSELTTDVVVTGSALRCNDIRIDSVDLKVLAADGLARIPSLTLQLDAANKITASGQSTLSEPFSFKVDADVALPELTRFNALLKGFGAPEIQSGSVASIVTASGQLKPWRCDGTATAKVAAFQMPSLPEPVGLDLSSTFAGSRADLETVRVVMGDWRLETRGHADDTQIELERLTLHQADRQLLAGNLSAPYDILQEAGPDAAGMNVQIDVSDLAVNEVLAAAGIDGMPGGRLHAEISLKGRPETATGHVRLRWQDLTVPQSPLNLKPALVDWETRMANDQVTSKGTVHQPPLEPMTLDASAPLSLADLIQRPDGIMDTPIEARVNLPKSDLSFLTQLAPDLIKRLPLTLSLNANVTGTAGAPKINAALDADAPEIDFLKADLPSVRETRVRIRSEDSLIQLEDLSAVVSGGRVKLGGTVDAKDPAAPVFDLNLNAREALVFRDPDTSVRANADINVDGTMKAARVTGLVEAVRGRVFKEIDFVPLAIPNTDLPAEPPSTARAEKDLVLPEMLKDWTFDVDVRTRDPVRISGNIAVGAVSADVHLGGTGANPLLTGGANIDEALLQLPFSRMKITKGVITLNPGEPFNPDLDIRGQSRIGRYDITLYVYGASVNPKTRFTSVPPLSEADIATLIATGTTLNGSASEVASEATTRALFLVASQLYRKVFNKRKKISDEPPKLSMTFNPSGADRQNDSVQASYEVTPKLRVTGRFRQNGQMKMMFGYLMRFGEAARAMDEPESANAVPGGGAEP